MIESKVKSVEELPMFINAKTLSALLGISIASCYELMHEKDFPTLRLGGRIVVPRDRLIEWINVRIAM